MKKIISFIFMILSCLLIGCNVNSINDDKINNKEDENKEVIEKEEENKENIDNKDENKEDTGKENKENPDDTLIKYINYNEITNDYKELLKDIIKINIKEIDYTIVTYDIEYENELIKEDSLKFYINDELVTGNSINNLKSNNEYNLKVEAFVKENIESKTYYQMYYTSSFVTKTYEKPEYKILVNSISCYDILFSVEKNNNTVESKIKSYKLYQDDSLITTSQETQFLDLNINTTYKIVIEYEYDLLDGNGLIIETVESEVKTLDEYLFEYILHDEIDRLDIQGNIPNRKDLISYCINTYQSQEIEIINIDPKAKKVIIPDTIKVNNIDYPVTKLKTGIFDNLDNLEIVKIGKNIDNIFYGAEYNPYRLPYVSLWEILCNGIFIHCPNLNTIIVDEDNQVLSSNEMGLFNKDKTIIYKYFETNQEEKVYLPQSVLFVNGYCFSNNKYIKEYY